MPLYYIKYKKVAGYSHRTAQPPILATFLSWGGSAGAGRVRPAGANVVKLRGLKKWLLSLVLLGIDIYIANKLIIPSPWGMIVNKYPIIIFGFSKTTLCFYKIIHIVWLIPVS